jgi:small subunit ribosomal protein S6
MMVVVPQIDDDALSATLERVNHYVSERGGTVVRQEPWGRLRRLAYPIKNYNEGNYYLTHLEMDPQHARDLEASLMLSEDVLRHLLVRVDAIPEAREAPKPQATAETATDSVTAEPSQAEDGASQQAPVAAATDELAPPTEHQVAVVVDEPAPPTEDQVAAVVDEPAPPTEDQVPVVVDEPAQPTEDQVAVVVDESAPPTGDQVAVVVDEPASPTEDQVAVVVDESAPPTEDQVAVVVDESEPPSPDEEPPEKKEEIA